MTSGLALKNVACRGAVLGRVTDETPLAIGGQPLKDGKWTHRSHSSILPTLAYD